MEFTSRNSNAGGAGAVIGRREGGTVLAGANLRPVRKRATRDVNTALCEVAAGFGQREVDGLGARDGACTGARDGDGGGRGVGGAGVDAEADLVVGLVVGARGGRVHIGV